MSDIGTTFIYLAIGSMGITLTALILKYVLKSKCSHISLCWGFLSCDRNVVLEEKLDEFKVNHGISINEPTANMPVPLPI